MEKNKELLLNLLNADSAQDVIKILKHENYWDDRTKWRYLGDSEGNVSTVENQQKSPFGAISELLTNQNDARISRQYLLDPNTNKDGKNEKSPKNLKEAVHKYFISEVDNNFDLGESYNVLSKDKVNKLIDGNVICVTGGGTQKDSVKKPCITVIDNGEGQTPLKMPDTILSLNQNNKRAAEFLQGKFNMGGSGNAFFCENGFKLIISKRCPKIVYKEHAKDERDHEWGYTIIRRFKPHENGHKKAEYMYLAPLDGKQILSVKDQFLPLLPSESQKIDGEWKSPNAFSEPAEYGTLIKLYEYNIKKKSLATYDILPEIENRLPQNPLPVRLYECRDFKGKQASFTNPVVGLVNRFARNKNQFEKISRASDEFSVQNKNAVTTRNLDKFKIEFYCYKQEFKEKKDGTKEVKSRANLEAINFTINGQSHGTKKRSFFNKKELTRLEWVKNDLWIHVDATDVSFDSVSDYFKADRDTLYENPEATRLFEQIVDLLSNHEDLIRLSQEREEKALSESETDETQKKLIQQFVSENEDIFQKLDPGYEFTAQNPIVRPKDISQEPIKIQTSPNPKVFEFLKNIIRKNKGESVKDNASLDALVSRDTKFTFDMVIDVDDNYFDRYKNKGKLDVLVKSHQMEKYEPISYQYQRVFSNQQLKYKVNIPKDAGIGSIINFKFILSDNKTKPIELLANCTVQSKKIRSTTTKNKTKRKDKNKEQNPSENEGVKAGIVRPGSDIPELIPVHKSEWHLGWNMNEKSCVKFIRGTEQGKDRYGLNMDNKRYLNLLEECKSEAEKKKLKLKYSMIMTAQILELINSHEENDKMASNADATEENNKDTMSYSDKVELVTMSQAGMIELVTERIPKALNKKINFNYSD